MSLSSAGLNAIYKVSRLKIVNILLYRKGPNHIPLYGSYPKNIPKQAATMRNRSV